SSPRACGCHSRGEWIAFAGCRRATCSPPTTLGDEPFISAAGSPKPKAPFLGYMPQASSVLARAEVVAPLHRTAAQSIHQTRCVVDLFQGGQVRAQYRLQR